MIFRNVRYIGGFFIIVRGCILELYRLGFYFRFWGSFFIFFFVKEGLNRVKGDFREGCSFRGGCGGGLVIFSSEFGEEKGF